MEKWSQTKTTPDDDRFVMLTLADGTKKKAQWHEKIYNIFRTGKQWVDENGKFCAVNFNPAVSWEEID